MSDDRELTPQEHRAFRDAVLAGAARIDRSRRRRNQVTAGAVALGLVLAVVGGATALSLSARVPVAVAPTPSASSTPAPTSTPPPSPTPTVTTPAPTASAEPSAPPESGDPATWIVTQAGMGPLRLGMPYDEAIAALPGARNACGDVYMSGDGTIFMSDGFESSGSLAVADWSGHLGGPGPRTPEGLGYGSSVAEVRAAYPDVIDVTDDGSTMRTGSIFFHIDTANGVVRGIGVTGGDVPVEYCG
jgi:hypothetical protein